jgi:hypothetical protein
MRTGILYTLIFVFFSIVVNYSDFSSKRKLAENLNLATESIEDRFCSIEKNGYGEIEQEICHLLLISLKLFSVDDIDIQVKNIDSAIEFQIQMANEDIKYLQENNSIRIQALKTLVNEAYIALQVPKGKKMEKLDYENIKVAIIRILSFQG